MKDRDLSAKELVKLIKACRAQGVSKLSFGNVLLEFGEKTMPPENSPTVIQTKETEAKAEEENIKDREKSELELREDQLEFMRIENPHLYEQLLIERELEHGPGTSRAN